MKQKPPYTCIRCGHECMIRADMRKHLFARKKTCQKIVNDIELTDEIKEHILNHRIYIISHPKNESNGVSFVNNITQYNTMNNFVANIDDITKIKHYTDFKNIDMIDYETSIEKKYMKLADKLENDQYHDFSLNEEDLMEVINQVSKINSDDFPKNINILYDKKYDEIKLYDCGIWDTYMADIGIRRIMKAIQAYYWDKYEMYLLRKLLSESNIRAKSKTKELLQTYYKFIGCFDLEACIRDDDTEPPIHREEIYSIYNEITGNTTKNEIRSTKKRVFDIIRKNSQKNIEELNKKVIELFSMDQGFKTTLVKDKIILY